MRLLRVYLIIPLLLILAACSTAVEPDAIETPGDTTEQPINEEPVDEEPVDEEPVDEEPVDEEPVDEEPVDEEPPGYINADGVLELTLEDLAYYNGRDGRKAYVAVDGVVYDMTDSSRWRNGAHNGFRAGQDLTDAIKNMSPHGTSTLSRVPQVGIIVTAYSGENE